MAYRFSAGVTACAVLCLITSSTTAAFPVVFGESWDGVPLQEILDAEYGTGAIDVATD